MLEMLHLFIQRKAQMAACVHVYCTMQRAGIYTQNSFSVNPQNRFCCSTHFKAITFSLNLSSSMGRLQHGI